MFTSPLNHTRAYVITFAPKNVITHLLLVILYVLM